MSSFGPESFGLSSSNDHDFIQVKIISPAFPADPLICQISKHALILHLKQKLRESRDLQQKSIKFIYCGTILEDSQRLSSYNIQDGTTIHCFASEYQGQIPLRRVASEEDVPRGFDRLREMGFSEEEVEHFRFQFYANNSFDDENDSSQDYLALEEEWINNRTSAQDMIDQQALEEEEMRNEGDNRDLFIGMTIGFLLGLIALYWMWIPSFSRKAKFGIVAGLACNLCFGIITVSSQLASSSS